MLTRFEIEKTALKGVSIVRRKPVEDGRGMFARLFCDDEFLQFGLIDRVCQINQSLTRHRGTIRGLHFQHPPHAEAKFVTCLRGEVFDVAVDLRRNSPTFLQWHGEVLSEKNFAGLYIPPGFAHGFQTMSDDCELLYLHSVPYRPDAEGALNAFDPATAIDWPLPVTDMSDRDRGHALITPAFAGIEP